MGHPGKHPIDPATGLCEICDRDAIDEIRQGQRPGKQFYYSGHDDHQVYHPNHERIPYEKDRVVYEIHDEPTPRYVRKPAYPPSTVRPRRVIYEQQPVEKPIVIRRKIVRREQTPPEEVLIHRPPVRPKPFYYVDQEGQMVPRTPPPEPPRTYVVQSRHQPPPPARTTRIVRRQAQTPPPPVRKVWPSGPRRQINSDTEILDRQQRMKRADSEHPPTPPGIPTMYHLDAFIDNDRYTPSEFPPYTPTDIRSPPPPRNYQGNGNRKQRRIEPEPQFERRVYKKLPPGKYGPPNNGYNPNENQTRMGRNTDRSIPPMKSYPSSPPLQTRHNRSPEPVQNSSRYQRPMDDY